ncbi:MAG: DUF1697 domain-containing protein [Lacisediminihabitans sp.]
MKHVALLRGINVGTAKSVSMADLASVFAELGFTDVKTALRSGNVVFEADAPLSSDTASVIERAVLAATGVRSSVLIFGRDQFASIAEANPLTSVATDGSKLFVTFLSVPSALSAVTIEEPDAVALLPEILRLGDGAIYQWMPNGSLQTKVPRSFWKQFETPLTARNWNTVTKLRDLLG